MVTLWQTRVREGTLATLPQSAQGISMSVQIAMPENPRWPRVAASIAVFRDGEVLLVERGKGPRRGIWSLPGGHIEPGETARAAAQRELVEETGVVADLLGLVDVHDVIMRRENGDLAAHYVLAVFYGRWQENEPVAATDVAAARFVPLADVAGMSLTPGAADFISRAYQLISGKP